MENVIDKIFSQKPKTLIGKIALSLLTGTILGPIIGLAIGFLYAFMFWSLDWFAIFATMRVIWVIVQVFVTALAVTAWNDTKGSS